MTPGDEAGALREEEETRVDSTADAHDDPAPAEPDPGAENSDDASENAGEASAEASVETASAEAPAEEEAGEAPVAETRAEETPATEAEGEDEAEADAEDDAVAGSGDEEGPRSAGVWAACVAVLVVLLIAGAVTAGMYWNKASAASADASGEQGAISTAETAVTDLFNIDYKNPDAWSSKLKPLAAGQFLGLVNNSNGGLSKILQEGKVQTSGKAQLAGVEKYSSNGDTAQVAVLGYQIIKNSQNPQGSERPYRMVLSMVKSGSKWVVSNVEFVQ